MASAEDLLISAVIQTGDFRELLRQGITAEMFSLRKKEFIWLLKFVERHDASPSKSQIKAKFPKLAVYRATGVGTQCEELKEAYARSKLTDIIDVTVKTLMAGHVNEAITSLGTQVLRVQARIADAADDYDSAVHWKETVRLVEKRIERVNSKGLAGVPTGFRSLDLATGGLQEGWLCTIGGRLGHGKTFTMVKMAVEAALAGSKVVYFSLEQSRHQIAMRSHAFLSKSIGGGQVFRPQDLMRGTGVDLAAYGKFLGNLSRDLSGSLVINDTKRGRVSPLTIAATIERNDPDIVFVDYLTLMEMTGDGGWLSVAKLTADLKAVAERYEKPIVVGSQLNRGSETGLDSSRLSRGDTIGHDSDLVLLLQQRSPRVIRHQLDKFRHGQDGITWMTEYQPGKGIYKEISSERAARLIETDKEVD